MTAKMCARSILLCSLMLLLWSCRAQPKESAQNQDPFANVQGAYLGQSPPGTTPLPFAPGLVSTERDEGGVVVYPGGREIYYWVVERRAGGVGTTFYVTRQRDGSWTRPEALPFSGTYVDGYIALHPDGSRLFFQSNRPIDPSESTFSDNIWYVDRVGDGWGEPRSIGRPINGRHITGGASVTRDGTLYFTMMDVDGRGASALYRSRYVSGAYQEPERLPDGVNAFHQNCDSYVAPDESYLVFTAFPRSGHQGNPGGLYISFRDAAGGWSDAREIGPPVKSGSDFGSATITPDGRYLLFGRRDDAGHRGLDIYWVATEVLDPLRQVR